jgi:hypothetical protein
MINSTALSIEFSYFIKKVKGYLSAYPMEDGVG